MKKIIMLTVAGLMTCQSALGTSIKSLDRSMADAMNQLQQSGYEVSLASGERIHLKDIYNLQGQELVLTGQGLNGIEIHVKASSLKKDQEVPSLILAAYRPNKERLAMTKVNFNLEGSYEQNKIHFLRAVSVFLKQVETQNRLPASADAGLLTALGIVAAFVIIPMVLFVHIQMKHSGEAGARALSRNQLKTLLKTMSAKKAKVVLLLLTLGLGIHEMTQN